MSRPFFFFSLRCWAITNCTSSGCRVPPPPQRLQVGGWCVGESGEKKPRGTRSIQANRSGLVIEINKVKFISSSTWGQGNSTKDPTDEPLVLLHLLSTRKKKKTILPVWTPQRPSTSAPPSYQPLSAGGRNCFFDFFATRQEERIFFFIPNSLQQLIPPWCSAERHRSGNYVWYVVEDKRAIAEKSKRPAGQTPIVSRLTRWPESKA
jgi:hypothetical protein